MEYAARCLTQNDTASQYWTRCIEFYKSKESLSQEERYRLVRLLLDISDLVFDDDLEKSYKFTKRAVEVAQSSNNYPFHFESLGKLMDICIERKDWARITEYCAVSLDVAHKLPYAFKEILKPLSMRALAYFETKNYSAALDDYQEGFRIAEKYGLLEKSIGFRVGIIVANSYVVASKEFADDSHLRDIGQFYDDIQDWIAAAWVMIFIADRARLNLKDQYNLYRLAKECAEKIRPAIEAIQIMSYVMPKLTEIWRVHEQEDNPD